MSDSPIIDAINQSQLATMQPQVVLTSGSGKAYQMVAQSCAIAIQDATDNLRNINTIAVTAMGVAMSQYLATGEDQYLTAMTEIQTLLAASTQNFTAVGEAAATVLKNFPSG